MNCLARSISFLMLMMLCAAICVGQAPASFFQLDGNAARSAGYSCTTPNPMMGHCDYWNMLNPNGNTATATQVPPTGSGMWSVRTFVNGRDSTNAFTGGGSKDYNVISRWAYSSTPTPNKDTINAAYAAAFNMSPELPDFNIIFGANRYSPNGDANIGIWFFQQTVGPNGTGGFTGAHTNGDVLILSAFTNGGGTSNIAVYAWNQPGLPGAIGGGCSSGVRNPRPGQCADTNLLLLANPAAVCGSSYYCAVTNTTTTLTNWEGNLVSPLFFSGGMDLTQAFQMVGTSVPCFSSFLVETRSSQSTSAVLKDFIAGGFPVCSLSLTKRCGTPSVGGNGTYIVYPVEGTVQNTGIGTLTNVRVYDAPGTSGGVAVTPSTLNAGQIGTWVDSSTTTASQLSDTAYATASASGTTIQSGNTAAATCTMPVSTTLTVSKACSTSLQVSGGVVRAQVQYGGSVCNTGPSRITNISLTDYPNSSNQSGTGAVVATGITLNPGTTDNPTCQRYGPLTYTPNLIDQTIMGSNGVPGDGPGRYFFSDLITITSATPSVGTLTTISSTDARTNGTYGMGVASCPVCNTNECVQ